MLCYVMLCYVLAFGGFIVVERCSTRAFSVALGLHHRLFLPHRSPKHTGHVVRQRGHLSGIWSAVLSLFLVAKRPSRLSGLGYLQQESITLGSLVGSYLALAEISVEALASPCPRTGVPSVVTCLLAWLGVFSTIPSDSTHVFRPPFAGNR